MIIKSVDEALVELVKSNLEGSIQELRNSKLDDVRISNIVEKAYAEVQEKLRNEIWHNALVSGYKEETLIID